MHQALARRRASALLVGVAGGIKINAAFVALGIAIPLLHDRAWARLARIGAIAGLTTFGLYYFSYGLVALKPLRDASTMVISPTHLAAGPGDRQHYSGDHALNTDDHRDRVRLAAAHAAARLVPVQAALARRADGAWPPPAR